MKYIFIHIPKTAGRFVKTLVRINPNIPNIVVPFDKDFPFINSNEKFEQITIEHQTISFIKNYFNIKNFEENNFLSIVRNPYSRVHSMWKFLNEKNGIFSELPKVEDNFENFLISLDKKKYKGIFFKPQIYFLDESIEHTKIFKYEKFEEFKQFVIKNNVRWIDKKINATKGIPYYEAYNKSFMLDIVKNIYYEDFISFNYNLDLLNE